MGVKEFVHARWIKGGRFTARDLSFDTILDDAHALKQPIQMQLKNKNVIVGIPDQVSDGVCLFIGEHDDLVFVNMDQIEMVRFYNPEMDAMIMEEQRQLQNTATANGPAHPDRPAPLEIIGQDDLP